MTRRSTRPLASAGPDPSRRAAPVWLVVISAGALALAVAGCGVESAAPSAGATGSGGDGGRTVAGGERRSYAVSMRPFGERGSYPLEGSAAPIPAKLGGLLDPAQSRREALARAVEHGQRSYLDAARVALTPDGEPVVDVGVLDLARSDDPSDLAIDEEPTGPGAVQALAIDSPFEPPPPGYRACLAGAGVNDLPGRVHNRFLWCQRGTIVTAVLRWGADDLIKVGFVSLDFEAVGVGRNEDRSVRLYFRPLAVRYDGFDFISRWFDAPYIELAVQPECTQTEQYCNVGQGPVQREFLSWGANRYWSHWDLFSHDAMADPADEDKVLYHQWHWAFSASTPKVDWEVDVSGVGQDHGLRCDSASYFSWGRATYPEACIFNDVIPHLQYRIGDRRLAAVARHIRDAQDTPDSTYPIETWSNALPLDPRAKTIPGKYTGSTGDPGLHRVPVDSDIYEENGRVKDAACFSQAPYLLTGLQPRPGWRQDCDEYPFASTEEGAANPFWDFSVRAVPLSQNRSAGGVLRWYYFSDRILYYDHDRFYVEIRD